ncbi:MAG: aminotransferase class I/II-fold pyridoxal phosphate-dependent enzyme [Fibrobacteria bacterium]|nr:aminotransferase class I/II-fold pyridoxal phosphate-dependent enzyme [Fibrobacteria bacterium]
MSTLDPQAVQLNDTISSVNPAILDMLSDRGKAIFFPKLGILSQSAEANGKDINATIGIAKEDSGTPMFLESIASQFNLPAGQSFTYAPSPGKPDIRKLWKEQQLQKNPSLNGKTYSNPVVTNALTHALGIAGFLFVDAGDEIILPDYYWENYDLTFSIGYGSSMNTFTTFTDDGGFNVDGLKAKLSNGVGKKIVLLNFPNNPTGYTPTVEDAKKIAATILEAAEKGNKIVVMLDDAYFGLVFKEGIYKESIFADLCDAHENIMAVKLDGPTKEDYVWGFRVGFLAMGVKNGTPELYQALEAKAGGAIRGTISNASHLSQSLLVAAWSSAEYPAQKQEKFNTMKQRYEKINSILESHPEYADVFSPLPYNSGYFMCVELKKGNAEEVRQKLLSDYSTGTIAFGSLIRIAFSCTPADQLEQLFSNVYEAAKACS